MGWRGWSKNLKRGGYPSFHSSFGATKDTKQNFQLLMQCFKNTQQMYSIIGTRCIFFYVSVFLVSVIIGMNELKISYGAFIFWVSNQKKNNLNIGQKSYWISLFFFLHFALQIVYFWSKKHKKMIITLEFFIFELV